MSSGSTKDFPSGPFRDRTRLDRTVGTSVGPNNTLLLVPVCTVQRCVRTVNHPRVFSVDDSKDPTSDSGVSRLIPE